MDHTVCTKAYIPYVLHIPSGHAWKDLGTDYGVYFFVFTECTDDFLRAFVSRLFPFCASRWPGATVKA